MGGKAATTRLRTGFVHNRIGFERRLGGVGAEDCTNTATFAAATSASKSGNVANGADSANFTNGAKFAGHDS